MMTKQKIQSMTEEEQIKHAQNVFAEVKKHPGICFLLDIAQREAIETPENADALNEFFMIASDLLGIYYDEFKNLQK